MQNKSTHRKRWGLCHEEKVTGGLFYNTVESFKSVPVPTKQRTKIRRFVRRRSEISQG
jgi:hypothetical protein